VGGETGGVKRGRRRGREGKKRRECKDERDYAGKFWGSREKKRESR